MFQACTKGQSALLAMVLVASVAFDAKAQVAAPPVREPIPNAHPSAAVNPPTTAGLKVGMPVRDPTGSVIGTISQVGVTAGGRPMAVLQIDGRPVSVRAANLSVAPKGGQAVSALTKAQLLAASSKG
jgi:hypothetical protein